ncbi:hypothetical protein AB2L27_06310 [Kineococcus sp. LSe6-4]|uniref:DUF5134 domain-containing protein n=1 Tax=Kineococcus halophytocola TaxID=3234027 RepID=A0ABV4GYJ2_9ACTN
MTPLTAVHVVAGLVGLAAALAGVRTARTAAVVMGAAMVVCLLHGCGVAVPFTVVPVLTLASWAVAWASAAAARRSGVPSPVPLDLLATAALLWLLPAAGHASGQDGGPAPLVGGAHLHATTGLTGVLAVLVAGGWLVAAVLRRDRGAGRVCGRAMAASMFTTALVTTVL